MLFSVHSYNATESEHLPVVHQVVQLIFVMCFTFSLVATQELSVRL